MNNLNKKPDYYDYIADRINDSWKWSDEAVERIIETMYGNKLLRERKMKIDKIYEKIKDNTKSTNR
jgi:hypothetical protein